MPGASVGEVVALAVTGLAALALVYLVARSGRSQD
jgi:hypothetical protein